MKCFHQFLISLCTAFGILFDMEEQEKKNGNKINSHNSGWTRYPIILIAISDLRELLKWMYSS